MKASEELMAARDELYAAIKPAIEKYQERTGLRLDEILVGHPPIYHLESSQSCSDVVGLKVRTNASSL